MATLLRLSRLSLAGVCALLALPAVALAGDGSRREAPKREAPARIIFGEMPQSDFEWRDRPVPHRTNADRQAYFGSGSLYSETLVGLQQQMDRIRARERLEGVSLTPAQEASKETLLPALLRALALANAARGKGSDGETVD